MRFVFVIFSFITILILTVSLRTAGNRNFYKFYMLRTEQGRLKQQLWQKQLRVENILNPASVSEMLKGESQESEVRSKE